MVFESKQNEKPTHKDMHSTFFALKISKKIKIWTFWSSFRINFPVRNGFTERLLWQDRKWNVICSLCFNIWIQIIHRYVSFHICLVNNESEGEMFICRYWSGTYFSTSIFNFLALCKLIFYYKIARLLI